MASNAELIKQDLTETISNGFVQYDLVNVYQTFTENRTDGFAGPLNAPGLPPRSLVLAGFGVTVHCTGRRAFRVDTEATEKKWNVECKFTNFTGHFERDADGNPVEDPTEAVKRVDFEWLEFNEPITDARFRGFTFRGPEFAEGAIPTNNNLPPQFAEHGYLDDPPKPSPIINSASVPILLERTNFRRVIKVSSIVSQWDNSWDDLPNSINSDEITIEESDSQGVRWSGTFQPLTLRMRPPGKENVWKDGRLYYRLTFVMEHNKNRWIHSELDAGTKRLVYVGQTKPDGSSYTQEDLDTLGIGGTYGYEEITTRDAEGTKVAIGDPIRFNGYGMELPVARAGGGPVNGNFFGNWDIHDIIPFAELNL